MFHRFVKHSILIENAIFYILCNLGEILINNTTGAHIHMSDFGISDLPCRQAHGETGSIKVTVAVCLPQPIKIRFLCSGNTVAFFFLAVTKTIEDQQHCRFPCHDLTS